MRILCLRSSPVGRFQGQAQQGAAQACHAHSASPGPQGQGRGGGMGGQEVQHMQNLGRSAAGGVTERVQGQQRAAMGAQPQGPAGCEQASGGIKTSEWLPGGTAAAAAAAAAMGGAGQGAEAGGCPGPRAQCHQAQGGLWWAGGGQEEQLAQVRCVRDGVGLLGKGHQALRALCCLCKQAHGAGLPALQRCSQDVAAAPPPPQRIRSHIKAADALKGAEAQGVAGPQNGLRRGAPDRRCPLKVPALCAAAKELAREAALVDEVHQPQAGAARHKERALLRGVPTNERGERQVLAFVHGVHRQQGRGHQAAVKALHGQQRDAHCARAVRAGQHLTLRVLPPPTREGRAAAAAGRHGQVRHLAPPRGVLQQQLLGVVRLQRHAHIATSAPHASNGPGL